jgi:RNA polymerase sigma-70 factor (ECF subfamily)
VSEDAAERLKAAGDDRARVLGDLFDAERPRLRRMVEIRMDARLKSRVDASDVIQDAYVEVAGRIEDWLEKPEMPFHLWVRFIAGQRLLALWRHHVGTKKRDARRQRTLEVGGAPGATSVVLADRLIAAGTTPTALIAREETRSRLVAALDEMEPMDREVLVLRHFEQLANADVATLLGLTTTAASNRYVRALKRLREIVEP